MGLRPVRTPEILGKVLESLEMGATVDDAARGAGICPASLYNWKRDDVEVLEALKTARSTANRKVTTKLMDKIDEGCTASTIFYLKTRVTGYREWKHETRPADLEVPEVTDAESALTATNVILQAAASGRITIEVAASLSAMVEKSVKGVVVSDLANALEELKQEMAESDGDSE